MLTTVEKPEVTRRALKLLPDAELLTALRLERRPIVRRALVPSKEVILASESGSVEFLAGCGRRGGPQSDELRR